jgi:hypothetical protein
MEIAMPPAYILGLVLLWTLPWKGVALWMAARREHMGWFVVMLILNTLALIEIIYIFGVARRYNVEVSTETASSSPVAEK